MGVSCSSLSTASSSTPDRGPPTTARTSAAPAGAVMVNVAGKTMPRNDVSNRYITKICAVGRGCNLAFGSRSPGGAGWLPRHLCRRPLARAIGAGVPGYSSPGRCLSAWPRMRRSLSVMAPRRSVVDYALARRATLASVFAGHTTVADVCDAHPYLLRAAKFHGEATQTGCPICRRVKLTHVTYVYGDELGHYEGRVKQGPELAEMAAEYGEFRAYVVEVCQSCGWNHLATSYVLGTGEPRARRGRTRARAGE